MPKLSVIIPVYNRAALLRATLESLVAQTLSGEQFEVLVCDDGSSSQEEFLVARLFEQQLNIRYVYQPDRGFRVAAARNLGLALAQGEFAVFVDSGMILVPGCLKSVLEACQAYPDSAYFGLIHGIDPPLTGTVVDTTTFGLESTLGVEWASSFPDSREEIFRQFGDDLTQLWAPWIWYWTGLATAPMDVAKRIGGFDEEYMSWGAEDVEFAYRLFRAGTQFRLHRGIRGVHLPHDSAPLADKLVTLRTNLRQFYRKHRAWEIEIQLCFPGHMLEVTLRHLQELAAQSNRDYADVREQLERNAQGTVLVLGARGPVLPELLSATCAYELCGERLLASQVTSPAIRWVHGLGVRTLFKDQEFGSVFVSELWEEMHPYLQEAILAEGLRVGTCCYLLERVLPNRLSLSAYPARVKLPPGVDVVLVQEALHHRVLKLVKVT